MQLPTFAVLALATSLIGCTTPQQQPNCPPKNGHAHWRKGEFTITFHAGPRTFGDEKLGGRKRSYSSYTISRQFPNLSGPTSIVVESAQDIEFLNDPAKDAQFFTSASGLTLLIAEDIPNECAPCTNYILVRVRKDHDLFELGYDYLSFPDRPGFPPLGPPGYETPEITKLTDAEITYRYRDGKLRTRPFIARTKRDHSPTFPG